MNDTVNKSDAFNVIDGYTMPPITLPTLPLKSLIGYLNNPEQIELASDLWYLTYDDEIVNDENLTKMTNTKYSLLRESKIESYKKRNDGTKKKATKDTLELMLNQSVFGRAGGLIRLAHSGFSVMLKPIDGSERLALQHRIANNVITLHRELTGDMYTGVYVTIHEAIIELFISKIDYTTIDIEKRADIKKYIKVKDLGLIQLAILDMIYPTGYEFKYICGELKIVDSKEEICSETSESHRIGIKELLYIADDLTDSQYEQLMSDTAKSISIAKVREYQENFKYNAPVTFNLLDNIYTIDPGMVDNFLEKSKNWLRSSIVENPMFKTGSDIEILKALINNSKIGMYFYTISKIENDVYEAPGSSITVQHINILSTRDDVTALFVGAAKSSLAYSYYQIGAPKYTCPSCAISKQEKLEVEEEWNKPKQVDAIESNDDDDLVKTQTFIDDVEPNMYIEPETVRVDIKTEKLPDNKDIFTNINILDLFSLLV
jgi:hypothetical protein